MAEQQSRGFSVRSGGHSFEGYCNSPEVVVDLRELDSVAFDRGTRIVTLGPGATIGKVQAALRPEGVAFIAGTCPTVGVAGHAMGGGYGLLARAYGLACDNLQSVRLVDANGAVVVADGRRIPISSGQVAAGAAARSESLPSFASPPIRSPP